MDDNDGPPVRIEVPNSNGLGGQGSIYFKFAGCVICSFSIHLTKKKDSRAFQITALDTQNS